MNSHADFIGSYDSGGDAADTGNDEPYEPYEPYEPEQVVRVQRPIVPARRPAKRLVKPKYNPAVRATKPMGGTKMPSNEFVALANSLKESIK